MAFKGGGKGGKLNFNTGGKFDEEDRSRDWYCEKCLERNFAKRDACHKCQALKPKDGGAGPPRIENGTTLSGMVKSYNRKGFGFIMCLNGSPQCQDIYYSRENLHISLQTRDIPGEHVTFEIQRFHDGKLVAKNIRPVGTSADIFNEPAAAHPPPAPKGSAKGIKYHIGADEEDRSRDWKCEKCGERNFMKRFECYKCKTAKKPDMDDIAAPRRTFSPHAGSRAVKESLMGRAPGNRKDLGARRRSGSSSSSSSRPRKKKKKAKKKHSSSRSSSSSKSSKSSKSSGVQAVDASTAASAEAAGQKNPEAEKAKAESLEKMIKLQAIEDMPARMKAYRELLRTWHPDKNPEKVEVATEVFQFLQKAKPMLDAK